MKRTLAICAALLLFVGVQSGFAQNFTNLNFESANIPNGTQIGSDLPFNNTLPGWSGSFSNVEESYQATQVNYDGISLGGSQVSIIDSNDAQYGYGPLQGKYSVFLFAGGAEFGTPYPTATSISQTGLVPSGTMSLLIDMDESGGITITLGGQTLNMQPIENFPTYSIYGADISSFAGQIEPLTITALPVGVLNGVFLDNIIFSTSPVPEPGTGGLILCGAVLFGLKRGRKN
jgi:hypothetical protein